MKSTFKHVGSISFPEYSGKRVMMMPFHLHDLDTLPLYREQVANVIPKGSQGTAYLTVDEALVRVGETHRRPGIHIDGQTWGGPIRPYAGEGMYLASSHVGCQAWEQDVEGEPGEEGCCEHLRAELGTPVLFQPNQVYWCNPTTIHEALPMTVDTLRQFMRISMPSEGPWYEGCTENPYGVKPTGPILPARTKFMQYRQ